MVSDILHALESQEGANSQHLLASVTRAPSVTEYALMSPRLKTGQQPGPPRGPGSYVCI